MLSGIGIWQLVIILVIVVMIFGTKRLKNLGGDLGGALKGFKKAMDDKPADEDAEHKKVETNDSAANADTNTVSEAQKTESK